MANKTIGDYTAANSIDAAADYMLIEQNSVYKKINRNVLLGLTSAPVGISDSQAITNKTFDNTSSYTIKDGSLTLQNTSSTTKQAVFNLSAISASTTRTISIPDDDFTVVGTGTTQTLTNKTLTSPTITGGTIDNSVITVDSIAGHSSSTTVTVANLQIANGVLNTINAVTSLSIAAGAVQPQALVTGTGSSWAWSSWTPTYTNVTPGNGVTTAKYIQIGKNVFFRLNFVFGSSSSISSSFIATLPVTANSDYATFFSNNVGGAIIVAGGNNFVGYTSIDSTTGATKLRVLAITANATYLGPVSSFDPTHPGTFTTNDLVQCHGFYEAA